MSLKSVLHDSATTKWTAEEHSRDRPVGVEGTQPNQELAGAAASAAPSSRSDAVLEGIRNLSVSGDISHVANTEAPAKARSDNETGRDHVDDAQTEGPCIVGSLSAPVRAGYDERDANMSTLSGSTQAVKQTPIKISLCRFESGRLVREAHDPDSVPFIAVSHVWGDAYWRSLSGVDGEVLVSDDKAAFIVYNLPEVVGDDWFWMDILCIDQRSKAARIAVTQHIPTIFRSAKRTLVVRTDSGYQQCCAEEWHKSWKRSSRVDASGKMFEHIRSHHRNDDCDEGILTRLWPYQEILLSDKIQFVRCERRQGANVLSATKISRFSETAIIDSLITTAIIWTSYGEDDGDDYSDLYYADFINAFFELGTVERTKPRGILQFPLAQEFDMIMNNKRQTTKARDFILAIMPQFSFYVVPRNAKDLTFSALFFDCIRQFHGIGHAMAPLIIRRSINFIQSQTRMWETDIPEPLSLGDFIKLLHGPQISYPPRTIVPIYTARVRPVTDIADMRDVIGSNPENELLSLARSMTAIHLVARQMSLSPQLFSLANSDLMHFAQSEDETQNESESYEIFIDAVHTLVVIAHLHEQGLDAQEIAAYNQYELLGCLNLESARQALLRLAAMIACNIGLGAFDWVHENLQTIRVNLPNPDPGAPRSALALMDRSCSLGRRFFLTNGGKFSFRICGGDQFKRWALFSAERIESGNLDMCIFPLEIRFGQWDSGQDYEPGPVSVMAAIL